jgi:hypothetical protein
MRAASRAGSQSEALLPRTFYKDKGGQPGSYCLSRTTRALVTSNLASKIYTLSLSTLWCGNVIMSARSNRYSAPFLSDVSWGKVRSLMEWRNTLSRPGWYKIDGTTNLCPSSSIECSGDSFGVPPLCLDQKTPPRPPDFDKEIAKMLQQGQRSLEQ